MSDQARSTRTSKNQRQKAFSSDDDPGTYPPPASANRANIGLASMSRLPQQPQHYQSHHPLLEGKMAIPRLRRESDVHSSSAGTSATASNAVDQAKVVRACEECRRRKIKCTGGKPACEHCEKYSRTCIYIGGKRDQLISQLDGLQDRVASLENALTHFSHTANEDQRRLINHALGQDSLSGDDDREEVAIHSQSNSLSSAGARPGPRGGEHRVSARVGSTEEVDKVTEDFDKDASARATGYHGKNSDLAWMGRLKKQTSSGSPAEDGTNIFGRNENQYGFAGPESQSLTSVRNSTYYCDDIPISVQVQVNLWALPPKPEADLLFKTFLEDVHPVFPILGKEIFCDQYSNFCNQQQSATPEWQAILNMIFAISEKRAQLISGNSASPEMHLIYYTRAKGLTDTTESDNPYGISLKHPNIQRVQIKGLMAFYLLVISQINRSWTMNGTAIRQAISLGLNLRNEAKEVTEQSKEIRYRVWWALCSTERMLTAITGRPAAVVETECSVPAPLPYEESQLVTLKNSRHLQWLRQRSYEKRSTSPASSSNYSQTNQSPMDSTSPTAPSPPVEQRLSPPASNALFFYHLTMLGIISSQSLVQLYRPPAMSLSWNETLCNIKKLTTRLTKWCTDLPDVLNFLDDTQQDQLMHRHSIILKFYYCSAVMLVNRPSLCRIDEQIPDESQEARDDNTRNAAQCVNAARGMLSTFPAEVNTSIIYQMFPWWCITHHIMQAMTVLTLELSLRGEHTPDIVGPIFDIAKKTLSWLQALGVGDVSAARAWRLSDTMLRIVAPKVGMILEHASAEAIHSAPTNPYEQFGLFDGNPHIYSAYDQTFLYNAQFPTTQGQGPIGGVYPHFEELNTMGYQPDLGYFSSYSGSSGL